jgi:phospholipid/cholesterol/gamma-HCH transport system substrate-binding protein
MKRSTFITWDQLKVGVVILFSIVIMVLAMFKLGQAANLFTKRYELITFLQAANGLREGGSVAVAGQISGTVKRIDFLPVDADTTRNLRVVMQLDRDVQEQIRADSKARLRTLGLLGDKIIDITPGTVRYERLREGDTVAMGQSIDYDQVIAQASGAVNDMVQLTHDLKDITGGIVEGQGTLGQLVTNRSLYDELTTTLARTNAMLAKMQNPNGTFGRMMDDPALYNHMTAAVASLDSLLVVLNSDQSTVGKLLRDDSLYANLVSITHSADSLVKMMTQGDGFAAQLLQDHELYDKLNKVVTDLGAILEDVRQNPKKYTKGLVKLF